MNLLAFELLFPLGIDISHLNSWISSIRSCRIEKLMIYANIPYPRMITPLPQCILSYSTLVYLKLSYFDIQISESVVRFPNLRSIYLQVIFPNSEATVNRLLSYCPSLEKLDLFGFLDSCKSPKIDISIFTLRRLTLWLFTSENKRQLITTGSSCRKENDIILDTPNLKYLSIEDDSFSRYVVKNVSRFSNVSVDYEAINLGFLKSSHTNHLLELLKAITSTELLTLSCHTVDVLGSAVKYTWPTFPYLKTLILQLSEFSGWTCFSKVLHNAQNLECLILDLEGINNVDDRPSGDDDHLYQWTPSDFVPSCLMEHLKLIGIQFFKGNEDELQVLEHVLNNARVLECMMIGFRPHYVKKDVVERLLMLPRASKD